MAKPTPRAEPPVFNLPNQLTFLRFLLAIVLFVLIPFSQWGWCFVTFAVAALTDWLDGYVARKQGLTSTLGRNLDPLVDKVLICGAYIMLLPITPEKTGLAAWMTVIVVSRELVVTGLRSFLENQGAKFGADWSGKIKMVLQCAVLLAIFTTLAAGLPATQAESWSDMLLLTRDLLIYAMVISTVISGLQYLVQAARLLERSRG
jgi:CDP-diacylglycerol--glycerol-3-phosphate 3-phosphatidyltransferase